MSIFVFFFIAAAIPMLGVLVWATKSYLHLKNQLEATKAQLASKEVKEKEELQKKLKQRRANILSQPVKAIGPPKEPGEDHVFDKEDEFLMPDSHFINPYLSQIISSSYISNMNIGDVYHSVKPLDYFKLYQNARESSDRDDQYIGYSCPKHSISETLTQPATNQHSINWNKRFQTCITRLRSVQDSSETLRAREEANINLLHLAQDFVDAAMSYGKIIISEHFLPNEKKTIQPQSLPGIIGGEKFVVHNILFKFAVDHKNIYGSDFAAAKAAGNELRGLMCYFNASVPDLNVPLMALVDYRGFRLTAMSLLPVDTNTIIYGTFDAGKTIHYTQDDVFISRMQTTAEILKLRPHICRLQKGHSHASSSPRDDAPFEMGSMALYERERTPLLMMNATNGKGKANRVRNHGATEEFKFVTDEGTIIRRQSPEASANILPNVNRDGFALDLDDFNTNLGESPRTTSGGFSEISSPTSNTSRKITAAKDNVSFNNQLMYSPVDLEGHKGLDGKYYLLDFSRVLPPETPNRKFQNPHLSRLLRPEFLKEYGKPLCSDAFSGFIQGTPEEDEITADIYEATRYLRETHIPKKAMRIYEMMKESELEKPLSKFRLTETMHSMGINCRYAGLLRKQIKGDTYRRFILAEVVARVVKNNLRWRLREQHQLLKLPLEEPYLRLTIDYLNLVFGNTPRSDEYWDNWIKKDIMNNFEDTLTEEEMSSEYRLKARIPSSLDESLLGSQKSIKAMKKQAINNIFGNSDQSDHSEPNGHQKTSSSAFSFFSKVSHSWLSRSDSNYIENSTNHQKEQLDKSHISDGSKSSPMKPDSSPNSNSSQIGVLRASSSSSGSSRDLIRSSASPISPTHHHRRHGSVHNRHSFDASTTSSNLSSSSTSEDSSSNMSSSLSSSNHNNNPSYYEGNSPSSTRNSKQSDSFASSSNSSSRLDYTFLSMVFERVKVMMGLQFTHDRAYSWDMEAPFNDTDLKNIGYKVKHMNIISHVQGFFWQINGLMARSSTTTGLAVDYYRSAIDKYEEALDLNPENKDILRNLALTWLLLIEEDHKPNQPFPIDDRRVQKVHEYIMRAISAPPKYDSLSLFRYANLLARCNKKEEAEDYYLQSLEADPNNTGCLHEYGEFLSSEGFEEEAELFYKRSSATTQGAQRFPENFY